MTRDENMPWKQLLLDILDGAGGETTLQNIYASIEKEFRRIKKEDEDIKLINPRLFEKNLKHGDRRIYTHTVRACLSAYKKCGLVEHIGNKRSGIYRLTDIGLKHLRE